MSWPTGSLLWTRERFVLAALAKQKPFAQVCHEFQITRPTGYKWLRRFRRAGRDGLRDRSRRPHHSPQQLAPRWWLALRQLRHVIQPGVPANCVLGCDNSTHASGCQQPALWGAGCTACNWCANHRHQRAATPNCRPEHAPCLLVPTMSGPSTSKAGIGPATARGLNP